VPLKDDEVQPVGKRKFGDALFEIGEGLRAGGRNGHERDKQNPQERH